jgi:hypothetical protein
MSEVTSHLDIELRQLEPAGARRTGPCFDFMVAFWGQRYREYFVNLCLASLLAPNNLPLLRSGDGHRFLIATTSEDWHAISNLPVFEQLREHATPTLVEHAMPRLSSEPGSAHAIEQQNVFQKSLVEIAYANRSCGCLLWPDLIISDGMVKALVQRFEEGCNVVLCCTLRQTEEAVLGELAVAGYRQHNAISSSSWQPLALSPRVTAALAVRHLHPDIEMYDADSYHQPFFAPFRYWNIRGHEGIVLHSLFAIPVLMNFAAIKKHDTECLKSDAFENVYLGRNFFDCAGVHVVQDSDEFGILSLTPMAVKRGSPTEVKQRHARWLSKFLTHCSIRGSLAFFARRNRDGLKRNLFRNSVRWHAADIDESWRDEEGRISRHLDNLVHDYYASDPQSLTFPLRISPNPHYLFYDLIVFCYMTPAIQIPVHYAIVIVKALIGNPEQQALIKSRVARIWRAAQRAFGLSQ